MVEGVWRHPKLEPCEIHVAYGCDSYWLVQSVTLPPICQVFRSVQMTELLLEARQSKAMKGHYCTLSAKTVQQHALFLLFRRSPPVDHVMPLIGMNFLHRCSLSHVCQHDLNLFPRPIQSLGAEQFVRETL